MSEEGDLAHGVLQTQSLIESVENEGEGGLFVPGEASPFLLGLNSQLTVLVITFVSETQFLIEKSPFN